MDTTEITLPPDTPFSNALTCQKCGCRDASVRQVTYPYVVSLVVLTFRREFSGRWCWKHRTLYLLLAGLITATLGWLGFPFGFIYTPAALYRLLKGGVQPKAANLKLLRSLAEAHEQRGRVDEARRCIEASFQYVDDLWGRQELRRYDAALQPGPENQPGGWLRSPAWLIASALVLSGLAGLLSFFADKGFDLAAGNLSLLMCLGPFFLWIPFALLFWAVLFTLRQVQERVLEGHPYRSPLPILGLALVSGLLAGYGFLEGRAIGNFLDILLGRSLLPSGVALFNSLGAVLTRGGLLEIPQALGKIEFWNLSHQILLIATPLLFPAALLLAAWPNAAWEKLLGQIQAQAQAFRTVFPRLRLARLAPFAAILCLAGLPLLFPQQSLVDFLEARDHFSSGNELMDDGHYGRAIAEYNTALRLDPLYTDAYGELGWAYYQDDDNPHAIAQLTRAIELDPNRFHVHYDLGRVYYNDDQLEQAAVEFEKTAQLKPDFHYAYLGMGWVAYDSGDLEKAEANFRKALEYDDKEYDAYLGLGYIYEDRDQLDDEIAAYQKAVEINPDSAESQMLLGMAYYDKNELDQAVTVLEKAVSLDEENQLARYYLTEAYVYTGNPDTAVEFSRQTLKLIPDWAGAHALLAFSLIETRQVDAAAAEIGAAQGIAEKTDMDRGLIIRALLNADRPEEAAVEAQAAIKESQHPSNFYLFLAEAYARQENYALALDTCEQAARAGAKSFDVLTQRAGIHLDQEAYDLSLAELGQAIQLEPKNAEGHNLLSQVYTAQENYTGAVDEAQQAVALDRYHYGAFLHLAISQLDLGYPEAAIKSASRAALLSPYADLPHYFLGMAYLGERLDRFAAGELQKFLDLYDGSLSKKDLKEDAENELKMLNSSS